MPQFRHGPLDSAAAHPPNLADSEGITITVDNVNRAPVLDPIGDRSVDEGATLGFVVSATDADGQTLTYGASNLPSGATFDPETRTFAWTPGYDQSALASPGRGRVTIVDDDTIGADIDGDLSYDLLWHNQSTGDLYAWLMDGTSVESPRTWTPRGCPPSGRSGRSSTSTTT